MDGCDWRDYYCAECRLLAGRAHRGLSACAAGRWTVANNRCGAGRGNDVEREQYAALANDSSRRAAYTGSYCGASAVRASKLRAWRGIAVLSKVKCIVA